MEKEPMIDFDDITIMKEKRRISREKGKREYDKTKLDKAKYNQRNSNKVVYDPDLDYNDYMLD